jgi:hypothetical protein
MDIDNVSCACLYRGRCYILCSFEATGCRGRISNMLRDVLLCVLLTI